MMKKQTFSFIRYANCWEDANLLIKALDIEGKTGLSVLSGGDNTLALLLKNPKKIVAFDVNKTQIHLFNLKKAGIKYLDYDDFLKLLGVYDKTESYYLFLSLKGKMEQGSFDYFANHPEFFAKGILNIGKFESYFQLFKKRIVPLFASKRKIEKFVSFKDINLQKEFYEKKINNKRLNMIFNAFFGFKVMGKFGRDKSFYDHVDDKKNSGKTFREHFDYGITHVPNYDNPYINYILTNRFKDNCLPLYLRRDNFEIIKKRIDCIEIQNTDLMGINGNFDFCNLSDIFEYMDDTVFKSNCEKLNDLIKRNGKIVYYNMQGKRYLDDYFHYLKKESEKYTKEMQAYFYNEFLAYEARKK